MDQEGSGKCTLSLCLVRLMSVITELCFTGDAVKREACSEETNVGEKIK